MDDFMTTKCYMQIVACLFRSLSKIEGINWSGISIGKLHKLRKILSVDTDLQCYRPTKIDIKYPIYRIGESSMHCVKFDSLYQSDEKIQSDVHIHAIWHDYHLVLSLRLSWQKGFPNFATRSCISHIVIFVAAHSPTKPISLGDVTFKPKYLTESFDKSGNNSVRQWTSLREGTVSSLYRNNVHRLQQFCWIVVFFLCNNVSIEK